MSKKIAESERDELAATVAGLREEIIWYRSYSVDGACQQSVFPPGKRCRCIQCKESAIIAALATPPPAYLERLKARWRAEALRESAEAVGDYISGHTFVTYAKEVLEAMAEAEEAKANG